MVNVAIIAIAMNGTGINVQNGIANVTQENTIHALNREKVVRKRKRVVYLREEMKQEFEKWTTGEIIEALRNWDNLFYSESETKWLMNKAADIIEAVTE